MEALSWESWNGFWQEQLSWSHNFVYSQLVFDSKKKKIQIITQFPQKWKILLLPKNYSTCQQELKHFCNRVSPQAPLITSRGRTWGQADFQCEPPQPPLRYLYSKWRTFTYVGLDSEYTKHSIAQGKKLMLNTMLTRALTRVAGSVLWQSPCAVNCYSLWLWSVGSAVQAPRAACHFFRLSNTQLS